jgi:predicted CopG family antitoxin
MFLWSQDQHMPEERTNISLRHSTWTRLNSLKQPGDSFDDVINRLIDESSTAE